MYTWGQLRLLLTAGAPGLSHDLLDGYLNMRYGRILDFYPWQGLGATTVLETVAAYNTGTVTVTQGLTTVQGAGTAWTGGLTGYRFQTVPDGTPYTATIVDGTDLALDRPFEGNTGPLLAYNLFVNVYPLPADCKNILSISSPDSGENLTEWSASQMAQASEMMTLGEPWYYATADDTPESNPPVIHEVSLYPAPQFVRGYPLRYTKTAAGFTGENTSNAILPWVSDETLLNGCRADIQAHLASLEDSENPAAHMASAKAYEALFQLGLAAMVRQDELRKPQKVMGMATHYTRYRRKRVVR